MLDTILIMTSIFCLILLMNIFKICNVFIIVVVVVPTYNWAKWALEKLKYLPKVSQLIGGRAEILTQAFLFAALTCCYPELKETRVPQCSVSPMFIAALFIIARTWKQPRCPSADEWIRKLWYIYTMEYYSVFLI